MSVALGFLSSWCSAAGQWKFTSSKPWLNPLLELQQKVGIRLSGKEEKAENWRAKMINGKIEFHKWLQNLKRASVKNQMKIRRYFQFAQALLDSDFPYHRSTYNNEISGIGYGGSSRILEARAVVQPPKQYVGIE